MTAQIKLGKIAVDVVFKDIKNIHLSVYPPTGEVRISAPLWMKLNNVQVFAISKLGWIEQQRRKFQDQEREAPHEYLDRESHYVWGKRYLLKSIETDGAPKIELGHLWMHLHTRAETSNGEKQAILESWYRQQLRQAVHPMIAKWEVIMGVKVRRFFVQRMKTKWGSCNPGLKHVRFNTDLAKKPREYLEYIVVHEMTHFLEPSHNSRFARLMDQFMPQWRLYRDQLNQLPLRHGDWF